LPRWLISVKIRQVSIRHGELVKIHDSECGVAKQPS